jgi:4a-hydroxytetrahydrobiopterin dehydratase
VRPTWQRRNRPIANREIAERLRGLPGWYFEDGWIRRVYKTDGWPTTLMLVNAIGYCAEAAYHHPDLAVTWGRVTVKLSTHSAGGITDKDFALARQIETSRCGARRGRRARRHAEQVRARRRSALRRCIEADASVRDRPARGTGAAARPRRHGAAVLVRRDVMGITVAALMTTEWIART